MYRKRATLFIISIILLFLLFYNLDWEEFFRVASKISLEWVLILLCTQAAIMFFTSLKWYVLIRRYGVSWGNTFQTTLIALMANNVTPMSIAGGEAVRAYVISKIDRIKMEKAFASVLADLFLSIIPILLLDLLAIFLVFKHSMDLRIAWFLAVIGIVIVALLVSSFSIIVSRGPSMRIFNALLQSVGRIGFLKKHLKRLEVRVDDLFMSFHRGVKTTMADTKTLAFSLGLSFLVWALTLARVWMIFLALNIEIAPDLLVIIYAVLIMVGIIPLLPGALGIWEWVGAGLFTFFGIPLEASVAVIVVDRLLFYWLPIITGFFASLHVGLNVMKVMDKPD